MKHSVKLKKLGRDHSHRKALIQNLMKSLIRHEKIITTTPRAKALRPFIEKLITRAKEDNMHNRRIVFARLQCKFSVDKLFEDIAGRYSSRNGGYTRVLKLYDRKGDNAPMALIELVEETLTPKKKTAKKPAAKKSVDAEVKSIEEASIPTEEAPEVETPATETEEK